MEASFVRVGQAVQALLQLSSPEAGRGDDDVWGLVGEWSMLTHGDGGRIKGGAEIVGEGGVAAQGVVAWASSLRGAW